MFADTVHPIYLATFWMILVLDAMIAAVWFWHLRHRH